MDHQALAEMVVELWEEIGIAYRSMFSEDPAASVHIALHEQAMKWKMTKDIERQRSGVPSDKKKKDYRKKATSYGQPTAKQLDFIEDLGGDPDSVSTFQEASDYIEELKEG